MPSMGGSSFINVVKTNNAEGVEVLGYMTPKIGMGLVDPLGPSLSGGVIAFIPPDSGIAWICYPGNVPVRRSFQGSGLYTQYIERLYLNDVTAANYGWPTTGGSFQINDNNTHFTGPFVSGFKQFTWMAQSMIPQSTYF